MIDEEREDENLSRIGATMTALDSTAGFESKTNPLMEVKVVYSDDFWVIYKFGNTLNAIERTEFDAMFSAKLPIEG